MRLVHEVGPGEVELNWAWLPTWLGHNTVIKAEIEEHVTKWMRQQPAPLVVTDETLDAMHEEVLTFLRAKFPEEPRGLIQFLEGLKHVHYGAEG